MVGAARSWCGWPWLTLALAVYIAADASSRLLGPRTGESAGGFAAAPSRALAEAVEERHAADHGADGASHHAADHSAAGHEEEEHAAEHTEGHASHPHEALFFLVIALLLGTMLLHLSTVPALKGLQQTVVLFLLGCGVSFIAQRVGLSNELGAFGRSYLMWMEVDPHLLLFAMLPPLLAGDAMTMDMHVARSVASQCLYLAGPGVVISALLSALILWAYLPYDWPFLLCLTVGAILCATDPVAVVALLKELGAPPSLTVQIQGEALLNDGTAIVLFTVAYNMLKGEEYSPGDVFIFLIKTALYAWIFGAATGGIFYMWIRAANNKLEHHSGLIQVALTIVCAYFSFAVAEGVFHISGVLATVASSLVLAHRMWPEIVCHQTMHTVWHMLEFIGNSVVFFLAGALTGGLMARIPFVDYVHLIVVYILLLIIRGGMILCSRPLLQRLSPEGREVPLQHALVMSWSGLRGAVGLAMAIQVSLDRAGGSLSPSDADRVLFYVGGIALLTLTVNATTCPGLVRRLGITKTPMARLQLMLRIHRRLVELLRDQTRPSPVRRQIASVLNEVRIRLNPPPGRLMTRVTRRGPLLGLEQTPTLRESLTGRVVLPTPDSVDEASFALAREFADARRKFNAIPESRRRPLLKHMPPNPLANQIDAINEVVQVGGIDPAMARAVNENFLSLVRTEYWKQIRRGELSSDEAHPLFASIATAMTTPRYVLGDFACLDAHVDCPAESTPDSEAAANAERAESPGCIRMVTDSLCFNAVIVVTILLNSVCIFEEYHRADEAWGLSWLQLEVIFTGIYTMECALKLMDLKRRYFLDPWCVFEFALVLLGIAGIIMDAVAVGEHGTGGEETQVARSVKVLKVVRAVRLVRLIKFTNSLAAVCAGRISRVVVANHLERFEVFFFFVRAHTIAQKEMLRFLGPRAGTDSSDVARCLLESQVSVFKGMAICVHEMEHLDKWVLEEMHACHECVEVTEELEVFVSQARDSGMLSAAEAEVLLHALSNHVGGVGAWTQRMRRGRITMGPRFCPEYCAEFREDGDAAMDDEGRSPLRTAQGGFTGPTGSARFSDVKTVTQAAPRSYRASQDVAQRGGAHTASLSCDASASDGREFEDEAARSELLSDDGSGAHGRTASAGAADTPRGTGTSAAPLAQRERGSGAERAARDRTSESATPQARQDVHSARSDDTSRTAASCEMRQPLVALRTPEAGSGAVHAPGDAVDVWSVSAGRRWVPGVVKSVSPSSGGICVEYRGEANLRKLRKKLPAGSPELRQSVHGAKSRSQSQDHDDRSKAAPPQGFTWPAQTTEQRYSPEASSLGRSWNDDNSSISS